MYIHVPQQVQGREMPGSENDQRVYKTPTRVTVTTSHVTPSPWLQSGLPSFYPQSPVSFIFVRFLKVPVGTSAQSVLCVCNNLSLYIPVGLL
jgi:hypothetical protein